MRNAALKVASEHIYGVEIGRIYGRRQVAAGAQKIYFEALKGLKPQGGPERSELVEGGFGGPLGPSCRPRLIPTEYLALYG